MTRHRKIFGFALKMLVCSMILLACTQPPPPPTEMPITSSSEQARQLFIQGRDKAENLETVEAAALFDQAIEKDPKFALAYTWRAGSGGGSQVAQKNREMAKSLIGIVTPGERLYILMNEAASNGESALQSRYRDTLLRMFPKDKRLKYYTGIYYRGLLDFKEAVKYYEEAVALDSMYAPPYNQLGYDNMELGNVEAAEKAFKTYIRLLPGRPNPMDSYAEFLRMQRRFDESLAQYKKVLEVSPSFVSSLLGLGDCYIYMGNPAKAREYYQEYIDKAPQVNQKAAGYYWKAVAFVHEGKIPEALKELDGERAYALSTNQHSAAVNTLANQGFLLTTFGKPSEGLKKYTEAIQPATTAGLRDRVRENYLFWSNYWFAMCYAEAGQLENAQKHLETFAKDVERRGNPPEKDALKFCEGYLALKAGRLDEAAATLGAIPKDPGVLLAQGMVFAKKGDKGGARKIADQIMKWRTNGLDLAVARTKAKAWL